MVPHSNTHLTRSHYKQQARILGDNLIASILILNYGHPIPVGLILSSFLLIYIVTLPSGSALLCSAEVIETRFALAENILAFAILAL